MSGLLFTCICMKATMPASSSPANRTIGVTGFRMHQAEMLRKFMTWSFYCWLPGGRLTLRRDLLARVQERTGGEDHGFLTAEPFGDGHAIVVDRADLDGAA